jgi:stage V sporulation protein B
MTTSAHGSTGSVVEASAGGTQEAARNAGRGGIAVLGAKIFFVLSGLVQQTLLPHVIGLAGYGALSRILALANIPNNVVVTGSTQGVSRAVARAPGNESEAFRATMRVHVPLAIVIAALFAAGAPLFARFEGATYITTPLAVSSIVLLMYGLYAPVIGLLNGRAQFARQAMLDVTFAVLRTAGLLGVGFLFVRGGGKGEMGSTIGFVVAATLIVPISLAMAGRGGAARGGTADASPLRRFDGGVYLTELASLAGAQFFTSTVMQVDITLLGRFLSHGAETMGLTGDTAAKSADEWVAVYRCCQLFAFLPYQLLLSVTQILFPMVARAKALGDEEAVRRYVERGARLAAIACGMMVAVIAGSPRSLLFFAFGAEVADRGASTLRILAIGQGAFTMMGIAVTVLASIGRERVSAVITFCAVCGVSLACFLFASGAAFGETQLVTTAIATSCALGLALLVAARAVASLTGGFLPLLTTIRVPIAIAAVVAAGTFLPRTSRLMTPLLAAGLACAYVVLLVGLREITRADASALRSIRS